MNFTEYLATDQALSLTALAPMVGVSVGRLSQLKKDGGWPPELALDVEKATGGVVDAGKLSPTIARARAIA